MQLILSIRNFFRKPSFSFLHNCCVSKFKLNGLFALLFRVLKLLNLTYDVRALLLVRLNIILAICDYAVTSFLRTHSLLRLRDSVFKRVLEGVLDNFNLRDCKVADSFLELFAADPLFARCGLDVFCELFPELIDLVFVDAKGFSNTFLSNIAVIICVHLLKGLDQLVFT